MGRFDGLADRGVHSNYELELPGNHRVPRLTEAIRSAAGRTTQR